MVYHPALYRLLGVRENGIEPSHYDLLGLKPHAFTVDAVRRQLTVRQKLVRQSVRGPQWIPIVTVWERQLVLAAETLSDPTRRAEYDAELATRRQGREETAAAAQQAHQAREVIQTALQPNGTLDEARRPGLAEQLRSLRVSETAIESSLEEIPQPAPVGAGPSPAAKPFFERAVDLCLSDGILMPRDERALKRLARVLTLSPDFVAAVIETHLQSRRARRIRPQPAAVRPEPSTTTPHIPAAAPEPKQTPSPAPPPPPQPRPTPQPTRPGAIAARLDEEPPRERVRIWPFLLAAGIVVFFLLILAAVLGAFQGCQVGFGPAGGP